MQRFVWPIKHSSRWKSPTLLWHHNREESGQRVADIRKQGFKKWGTLFPVVWKNAGVLKNWFCKRSIEIRSTQCVPPKIVANPAVRDVVLRAIPLHLLSCRVRYPYSHVDSRHSRMWNEEASKEVIWRLECSRIVRDVSIFLLMLLYFWFCKHSLHYLLMSSFLGLLHEPCGCQLPWTGIAPTPERRHYSFLHYQRPSCRRIGLSIRDNFLSTPHHLFYKI